MKKKFDDTSILMFVMMLLLSVCHLIWHVLSPFGGKLEGNLTFRFYYFWFLVNLTHAAWICSFSYYISIYIFNIHLIDNLIFEHVQKILIGSQSLEGLIFLLEPVKQFWCKNLLVFSVSKYVPIISPLTFLGKPILGALKDEYMVLMVTVVYVAIFFSPKDLVHDTIKLIPIYATICFLKEILRAKKVYKGLAEGRDHMPHGGSLFFIPVLIATLKGK